MVCRLSSFSFRFLYNNNNNNMPVSLVFMVLAAYQRSRPLLSQKGFRFFFCLFDAWDFVFAHC
eukprot:m.69973 g.69973  ORF g.69973 m.69973 type:complete len:63 (+) comp7846_c2_seq1:4703-4891(+)